MSDDTAIDRLATYYVVDNTPTPAPLTDEQIEALTHDVLCVGPTMSAWYAAVIARAKREERERIGAGIALVGVVARDATKSAEYNGGVRDGLKLAGVIAAKAATDEH